MKVNTCLYTCACIYVFGVGLVAVRSNCNLCVAENISWKRSKAKGMMLCVCVCERVWWARCIREPTRLTHSVLTQFTSNVVEAVAVAVAVAIGAHTEEISAAENSTKMKSAKPKILDIYLQNSQYCEILKEIKQSAKNWTENAYT